MLACGLFEHHRWLFPRFDATESWCQLRQDYPWAEPQWMGLLGYATEADIATIRDIGLALENYQEWRYGGLFRESRD